MLRQDVFCLFVFVSAIVEFEEWLTASIIRVKWWGVKGVKTLLWITKK